MGPADIQYENTMHIRAPHIPNDRNPEEIENGKGVRAQNDKIIIFEIRYCTAQQNTLLFSLFSFRCLVFLFLLGRTTKAPPVITLNQVIWVWVRVSVPVRILRFSIAM